MRGVQGMRPPYFHPGMRLHLRSETTGNGELVLPVGSILTQY
jgi:hypothetical protein